MDSIRLAYIGLALVQFLAVQQHSLNKSVLLQWQQLTQRANGAREFYRSLHICSCMSQDKAMPSSRHVCTAVKSMIAIGRHFVSPMKLKSDSQHAHALGSYLCPVPCDSGQDACGYMTPASWLLPAFGRCLLEDRVKDERNCYSQALVIHHAKIMGIC